MRWLLLLLLASPLTAQTRSTAAFGLCCTHHWQTSVAHGVITLGVGVGGAVIAPAFGLERTTGARLGSLGGLIFYTRREVRARSWYAREYEAGRFTDREYAKVRWDSFMDTAWPVWSALVVWSWPERSKLWPLYVLSGFALWHIGQETDPGGVALGLY